jgi:DNA-binding NarL/FixJ family response regulator
MRISPLTVIVADEHDIFRIGIRAALESTPDIEIVGEADTEPVLLGLLSKKQPDVILLDLAIPLSKGVNTLLHVRQSAPEAKILLLGYDLDDALFDTLQKAGANGYLSKAAEITDVERAIRTAVSKGYFFSDPEEKSDVESVFRPVSITPLRPRSSLTEKEVTILRLMCQEQSTRDIASSLSISPRTVESIRDRIKFKTGSRNLAGLAFFALKFGLIRLE